MKKIHLTFDIDWAPDWYIPRLLEQLDKSSISASFFITHEADYIKNMIKKHEIGIHPNFLKNSSHGKSLSKIINYFSFVKEARLLRTHALFQSSPLMEKIFLHNKNLKYDLSMYAYRNKVQMFDFISDKVCFKRILFNWSDGTALVDKKEKWNKNTFKFSDLIVVDFHPIHLILNSNSLKNYNNLKKAYSNKPLNNLSENEINKFINKDFGIKFFLKQIIDEFHIISFSELLCELES